MNSLQHTKAHCSTLQHTATHCNALQHTAMHRNAPQHNFSYSVYLLLFSVFPVTQSFLVSTVQYQCLRIWMNESCLIWMSHVYISSDTVLSSVDCAISVYIYVYIYISSNATLQFIDILLFSDIVPDTVLSSVFSVTHSFSMTCQWHIPCHWEHTGKENVTEKEDVDMTHSYETWLIHSYETWPIENTLERRMSLKRNM